MKGQFSVFYKDLYYSYLVESSDHINYYFSLTSSPTGLKKPSKEILKAFRVEVIQWEKAKAYMITPYPKAPFGRAIAKTMDQITKHPKNNEHENS